MRPRKEAARQKMPNVAVLWRGDTLSHSEGDKKSTDPIEEGIGHDGEDGRRDGPLKDGGRVVEGQTSP